MENAFKDGDVVMLKSGGFKMTVERVDSLYGLIDTVWFDDKKQLQRGAFPPVALEAAAQKAT
ncbi:DUF2158 domain-containing protein [Mesorhizobium sp. M1E.F.Ca.ET.063.01.1.1]|uniref:YodC family protein n=1 Tax=Mesorhizobium sp. M1E.F.Ca.ET.063.01.1.1 TaxID=2496750 RepID=UPI000FCCDF95|nr:DUF2158 domain-containing protein [Mesorhizobium sp. M1E.F.Ca.ET.063.01.1.1]RUW76943.1 DUF2158 domain-containing protein [Mesorhizobium sp. M1E.F.Ca.ET.063.01.1.1]